MLKLSLFFCITDIILRFVERNHKTHTMDKRVNILLENEGGDGTTLHELLTPEEVYDLWLTTKKEGDRMDRQWKVRLNNGGPESSLFFHWKGEERRGNYRDWREALIDRKTYHLKRGWICMDLWLHQTKEQREAETRAVRSYGPLD